MYEELFSKKYTSKTEDTKVKLTKLIATSILVSCIGCWMNIPSIHAAENDTTPPIQTTNMGELYKQQNNYNDLLEQVKRLELAMKENKTKLEEMKKQIAVMEKRNTKDKQEADVLNVFIEQHDKKVQSIKNKAVVSRYFHYVFNSSEVSFPKRVIKGFDVINGENQLVSKYQKYQKQVAAKQKAMKKVKTEIEKQKVEVEGIEALLNDQKEGYNSLSLELQVKEKELNTLSQSVDKKEVKTHEKDLSLGDYDLGRFKANKIPIHKGTFTFPTIGKITTLYGSRQGKKEIGITIGNKSKESVPVIAVADGIVTKSLFSIEDGHVIHILHSIDNVQFETIYAHLNTRVVNAGEIVSKGSYLGTMGDLGPSKGKLFYFEMRKGQGEIMEAVNPLLYIPVE